MFIDIITKIIAAKTAMSGTTLSSRFFLAHLRENRRATININR